MNFEDFIVNVPDFPKKGIIFKDISPLLANNFSEVISEMGKLIDWTQIDVIVGIESRGFILGSGLAALYSKGFIPVRKKGKLPPPVISHSYDLEYGSDTLEIKPNATSKRVLIVDDVLATGGTMKAAISLCEKANYKVAGLVVLINLKFLNTFEQEGIKVKSILNY
ncbi:MAG: adenine phosphoribosyltransferase [Bacteriovoracaceae bacterium]